MFFNLLFSSKALFSSAFTAVISAAWPLILWLPLSGSCGTTDLLRPHYPLLQMLQLPPLYASPGY